MVQIILRVENKETYGHLSMHSCYKDIEQDVLKTFNVVKIILY